MSKTLDRLRDERIKALIKQAQLRRESDRGRLLQQEKPLPSGRCTSAASA